MDIANDCVVSFDYTLRNEAGEVLDSSSDGQPLTYLHGHGNIIPGLEQAMTGRQTGDAFKVDVSPEDGYGMHREELVQTVPPSAFEGVDGLAAGMRFSADSNEGPMVVTVTAVSDDGVTVDGNHELAGMALNFEVAITEVRQATPQELEHGHVHAGGHDH